MEISRLTESQRRALLDLLILAMYADGHLDLGEDARLQRLLTSMGVDTEYDRDRELAAPSLAPAFTAASTRSDPSIEITKLMPGYRRVNRAIT